MPSNCSTAECHYKAEKEDNMHAGLQAPSESDLLENSSGVLMCSSKWEKRCANVQMCASPNGTSSVQMCSRKWDTPFLDWGTTSHACDRGGDSWEDKSFSNEETISWFGNGTEGKKISFQIFGFHNDRCSVGGLDLLLNLDSSLKVWIFVGLYLLALILCSLALKNIQFYLENNLTQVFFQLEGVRSTYSDPIRIREAGELVDRRSSEAFSGDEGSRGGHGVHHLPGGQPESDSLYQSTELAVDSRLKMTLQNRLNHDLQVMPEGALEARMGCPCNRSYHSTCLATWLRAAQKCPLCRGAPALHFT